MQDDDTLASGEPAKASVAEPGNHLGKYEILRTLGSGGMGMVWAAHDPDLDREVAIKLLRGERASTELRTRLLREARAMARLKHPNVLTVYEVASDAGRDFIVMEIVDGESLDVWLRDKPPEREVWDALLGAGRGLAAAHAAGLVHRDFKPHNVLRSRDGRVLVTDFGLARGAVIELAETAEPSAADSILDVQLTATGQLLGTPAYMAPEQFDGATDARTDQFGYCVTAWEALSGTRPYDGTTLEQLREAARSGAPKRDAKLPPGVRAVLARGLAPDPASRWADMGELLAALERTRRVWPRRVAVLAPFVLFAGALAVFFGLRSHGPVAAPCVAEQAFGSAWTPEQRADVVAKHPELASFVPTVDSYRTVWLTRYEQACRNNTQEGELVRACYREQRDEVALYVELLQRYKDGFVGARDFLELLGGNDPCAKNPISRPPLPNDARRDQVLAYLATAYGTLDKTGGMIANFDQMRSEAKSIGWPPLDARLEEMIADASAGFGNDKVAQPAYRRAADLAHAVEDHVTEAHARLGVLKLSGRAFEHDIFPQSGYDSQLRDAELAIHEAGDDDRLHSVLDHMRALHAAYAEGDLTKAIGLEFNALMPVMVHGDIKDMVDIGAALVTFANLRAGPKDHELAKTYLDQITKRVRSSAQPRDRVYLSEAEYWTAWLEGDLSTAHAFLDDEPGKLIDAPPISGTVVDAQGKPVAGARVVIWTYTMYGDPERVFTAPQGTELTTKADGTFTGPATDYSGVIAEHGDQRSMPVLAKNGVQLVLGPTRSISGVVDAGGEPTVGIEPYARIEVTPTLVWYDSIAPAPDGHYTLGGIPAAATHVELGALGSHWPHDNLRRVVSADPTIHWPIGDTIDVFVADFGPGSVWLMRGKVAPKNLGELMKLSEPPESLHAGTDPVGWMNATESGLVAYRAGSRHAVFHDIAPGEVTVCVMKGPKPVCKTITAGAYPAPVRDGRHWPSGNVVSF